MLCMVFSWLPSATVKMSASGCAARSPSSAAAGLRVGLLDPPRDSPGLAGSAGGFGDWEKKRLVSERPALNAEEVEDGEEEEEEEEEEEGEDMVADVEVVVGEALVRS